MKKGYLLTKKQEKVFRKLEKVLSECREEGILFWDNCGTLCALNERKVIEVYSHDDVEFKYGEEIEDDYIEAENPFELSGVVMFASVNDLIRVVYKDKKFKNG